MIHLSLSCLFFFFFLSVFDYFSLTDEEPGQEEGAKVQHSGNTVFHVLICVC